MLREKIILIEHLVTGVTASVFRNSNTVAAEDPGHRSSAENENWGSQCPFWKTREHKV